MNDREKESSSDFMVSTRSANKQKESSSDFMVSSRSVNKQKESSSDFMASSASVNKHPLDSPTSSNREIKEYEDIEE